MDEAQYSLLEEILSNKNFISWAQGNAPELDQYWHHWAGNDALKKRTLQQAREIATSFRGPSPIITDAYILQKVSHAISEADSDTAYATESGSGLHTFNWKKKYALIAAVFVFALLGLNWWIDSPSSPLLSSENEVTTAPVEKSSESSLLTVKNDTKQRKHVRLSDGSSVLLQPGSSLQFASSFVDGKREVRLEGEAFFEVVKNEAAPFYILANQTVTRVLGTSFRLKAKPNTPFLEINVKTGRVAVFKKTIKANQPVEQIEKGEVILLQKNQKALFEITGNELSRQIEKVEIPDRLSIEQLSFSYEETPISQVFAELEEAYGVTIAYDARQAVNCSLTAELGDEPLTTKLKWISVILEADYTFENNEITISGQLCH